MHHVLKRFYIPPSFDPEDLIQEGLLALWRVAPSYDPQRGAWSTYACLAVRHAMLVALRQHRKRGALFSEMNKVKVNGETLDYAATIPAPEEDESHHEEVAILLARLSPRDRDVIELRYGLKDREPKTLDPHFPDEPRLSAWHLRQNLGKPSVSDPFLLKRPRHPMGDGHHDPLRVDFDLWGGRSRREARGLRR